MFFAATALELERSDHVSGAISGRVRSVSATQAKQVLAIRKIRDDNHCTVTSDPTHARAASTVMAKSAQKP
jgi:hypothetical protein